MSTTYASAFIERMKIDQNFASRIIEANSKNERKLIAKSEGFIFTPEELSSVLNHSDVHDSIIISQRSTLEGCGPESCCS
jgi:predicted ribosomally synthesized peptide with nif11-like leader